MQLHTLCSLQLLVYCIALCYVAHIAYTVLLSLQCIALHCLQQAKQPSFFLFHKCNLKITPFKSFIENNYSVHRS